METSTAKRINIRKLIIILVPILLTFPLYYQEFIFVRVAALAEVIGIGFMVYLVNFCRNSYGKLSKFLSHKFWIPISKMELTIFMVAAVVQRENLENSMNPIEVNGILHFVSRNCTI